MCLSDPRCKASYRTPQPTPPARPPPIPTPQPVKVAISEKAQMKKVIRMGSKHKIATASMKKIHDELNKDRPNWRAMDIANENLRQYHSNSNNIPPDYYRNRSTGRYVKLEDRRPPEVKQRSAELLKKVEEEYARNERMRQKGIITSSDPKIWDKNAKLYAGMGRYKKKV